MLISRCKYSRAGVTLQREGVQLTTEGHVWVGAFCALAPCMRACIQGHHTCDHKCLRVCQGLKLRTHAARKPARPFEGDTGAPPYLASGIRRGTKACVEREVLLSALRTVQMLQM